MTAQWMATALEQWGTMLDLYRTAWEQVLQPPLTRDPEGTERILNEAYQRMAGLADETVKAAFADAAEPGPNTGEAFQALVARVERINDRLAAVESAVAARAAAKRTAPPAPEPPPAPAAAPEPEPHPAPRAKKGAKKKGPKKKR